MPIRYNNRRALSTGIFRPAVPIPQKQNTKQALGEHFAPGRAPLPQEVPCQNSGRYANMQEKERGGAGGCGGPVREREKEGEREGAGPHHTVIGVTGDCGRRPLARTTRGERSGLLKSKTSSRSFCATPRSSFFSRRRTATDCSRLDDSAGTLLPRLAALPRRRETLGSESGSVADVAPLSGSSTLVTDVVNDSWDDDDASAGLFSTSSTVAAALANRATLANLARFAGATNPSSSSSPSRSRSTLDACELGDLEESLSKEAASASIVEFGEVGRDLEARRCWRPMPRWVPLARRTEL